MRFLLYIASAVSVCCGLNARRSSVEDINLVQTNKIVSDHRQALLIPVRCMMLDKYL